MAGKTRLQLHPQLLKFRSLRGSVTTFMFSLGVVASLFSMMLSQTQALGDSLSVVPSVIPCPRLA